MKKRPRRQYRESLYSARMQGGPLDGLDVYTIGQPLLLVEDVIDQEKTVCFVRHAYQMSILETQDDVLHYDYVGWLKTEEQDVRSTRPELN